MVLCSFFCKKGIHVIVILSGISSKRLISTCWLWAELNNLCKASHRLFNLIQGLPLNWISLIARIFLLYTQFISSQGPYFLLAASSIFLLKKIYLVFLTIFQNFSHSSTHLDYLYAFKSLQQSSFHHALEYFVIFIVLENLSHILLILLIKDWTMVSKALTFGIGLVLILLI